MPEPVTGRFETQVEPTSREPNTGEYRSQASTGAGDADAPGQQRGAAPLQTTRFTILKHHARGGLGQVSLARDERLKRPVALKEIRPDRRGSADLRQRFLTEAEITSQLQHPGIVPVYALDEDASGEPYYAMRFIEGKTLAEAIKEFHSTSPRFDTLPFRALLQRFVSVCNTIAYAHSKGVIHRDLKPANVMLGDYGETLVVDWGLAKRMGVLERERVGARESEPTLPPSDALTEAGQVMGTAPYLSPEQARGDAVAPLTDVYALGAMLYELLTGRCPYSSLPLSALLDQVKAGKIPATPRSLQPHAPKPLDAICRKAMNPIPTDRYPNATDLARDVDRWLADEPVSAFREPMIVRYRRWARKHRTLVTSLAAVLVVGFVALAVGLILVSGYNQRLETANTNLASANVREVGLREQAEKEKNAAQESEADTKVVFTFLVKDVLHVARPEGQEGGLGVKVTVREALDAAAPKIAATFKDRPRAEAETRFALGSTYVYLGEHPSAIRELEQSRALCEQVFGPAHEKTAECMNNLGGAYLDAGRASDAVPLYVEANRLLEALFGPTHPYTLQCCNNLVTALERLGRRSDAVSRYEEILKRMQERLGSAHPNILACRNNLAGAYSDAGRLVDATRLYEETLKLAETQLGRNHPHALISRNNLAGAYRQANRLSEAIPLFEEALRLKRMQLGPTHPDTLRGVNDLAAAYLDAGRTSEAVPVLEEALHLMRQQLGSEHPDTLQCMNSLAAAYLAARRLPAVLPLFEEILKLRRAKLGPAHADTLISMNNLAYAYKELGRPADALPLYRETLKLQQERLGPTHAHALVSAFSLGLLQIELKDYSAAEPHLLLCQAEVEKGRIDLHANIRRHSLRALISLYDAWGKPAEVEKWRAKLPPPERLRDGLQRQYAWPLLWGWPRF